MDERMQGKGFIGIRTFLFLTRWTPSLHPSKWSEVTSDMVISTATKEVLGRLRIEHHTSCSYKQFIS